MATRYTMKDLDSAVRGLNRIAGFSEEECDAPLYGEDRRAMVGRYYVDAAYGGVRLVQVLNEGGGIRAVTGYASKRETYHAIHAYREGMGDGVAGSHYSVEALRARIPEYRAERAAYAAKVAEMAAQS